MRVFTVIICVLLSHQLYSQSSDSFRFPNKIEKKNFTRCTYSFDSARVMDSILSSDLQAEIENEMSYQSKIEMMDINSDGECEVLHYYSSSIRGWPYDFLSIYRVSPDGNTKKIGDFPSYLLSFAEAHNGGLQIICGFIEGHKTNPVYYSQLYRLNGEEYQKVEHAIKNKGEYRDAGLRAYKEKNYELAYTNFRNALLTPHHAPEDELHDANNVALALIKLKSYNEAKSLLLSKIDNKGFGKIERAAAYFNLGLIEERESNIEAALEYYKNSCRLRETIACKNKVHEINKTLTNPKN